MSGNIVDDGLFARILVPLAWIEDVEPTASHVLPILRKYGGEVIIVHVIKTTEGGIDPVPLDISREDTDEIFNAAHERFGEFLHDTEAAYSNDIGNAILGVAEEINATSIVFLPHKKSRLIRWLSGDVALSLITNAHIPVVSLPFQK